MRKMSVFFICCSLICIGAYRWGDIKWERAKIVAMEHLYLEVSQWMVPYLHSYEMKNPVIVCTDVKCFFLPAMKGVLVEKSEGTETKDIEEQHLQQEEIDEIGQDATEDATVVNTEEIQQEEIPAESILGEDIVLEKKVIINPMKLQEFDYLRQNFYQVDNTTTIGSEQLDANKLLGKDMTIKDSVDGPQILIYHTHSQEAYKDSVPGDVNTSIIGVGNYLETLLEEKYGIQVLHHTGTYDLPSRDNAYSNALPNIEKLLQENPTIEVVIDLHRDGVAENRHLVTEINGKPTAKIMFFNGLSRTTLQGNLTYLPNPYIEDNLALSFQLQLAAEEYYPGLARKIYLKGYRYNLHLKPKSMLVEVGAQTNTFAEAQNAMEPLADILAVVLKKSQE